MLRQRYYLKIMILLRNCINLIMHLCIVLFATNYLDLNALTRKGLLVEENETMDRNDTLIKDKCCIILNEFNWGD